MQLFEPMRNARGRDGRQTVLEEFTVERVANDAQLKIMKSGAAPGRRGRWWGTSRPEGAADGAVGDFGASTIRSDSRRERWRNRP
jgi:hypothetical protein